MTIVYNSIPNGKQTSSHTNGASWRTLQDLLQARADSGEKITAYAAGDTTKPLEVTYGTLYSMAKKNSLVLKSLKAFRPRHPVLLHLDDHWDTILWFWSVLLADGVPVPSTPFSNVEHHRRKHIQGLSDVLESPICITRDSDLELFGEEGPSLLHLHTIESLSKGQQNGAPHTNGNSKWAESDLALLMLTSGSTGNAKAVQITHRQVLAALAGKVAKHAHPANLPFLNWIGLDHVASVIEIHILAMYIGVGQVHVHPSDVVPTPETFMDLLTRHKVSRTFAPNFFLGKLVSNLTPEESASWDLSNLAILASGGEANDIRTCIAAMTLLEKYGAPHNVLTTGFGMTETCAGCIYNTDCPSYDIANGYSMASLGQCNNGTEMRVTKTTSNGVREQALPNEAGDLEVRGAPVFGGYYRNPEATAAAFTPDGWFRTGDQAFIDAAGNLCLAGRVKDVININGVKFVTSDIQAPIDDALGPLVGRLVVFPSQADHTEQITIAYIPKAWPMRDEEIAEIETLALQSCMVSAASRPFVFHLGQESVKLLPTTTLGKIPRTKMRSLFESGTFAKDVAVHFEALERIKQEKRKQQQITPPQTESQANLINDFISLSGADVDIDMIGIDTPVYDLGFTSMDLVRLKRRVDARLKTSVPVITFMKNATARLLAAALDQLSQPVSSGKYDPIVELRPTGNKTPLWLIHPGVGEILVFVGLSKYMNDDDRPVYALRARGFEEGQERFGSITETVDCYVSCIKEKQPHGPYAIAGYSYGTMLAFEVSKRLNEIDGGDAVQFLGSFNLPPHIKHRMRYLNWNLCLLNLSQFLELVDEDYVEKQENEKLYREKSREEALEQVLGVADKSRMEDLALDREGLVRWATVAFGLQSMASDYEPSGQVPCMDIFHAIPLKMAAPSREVWVNEHLSKWKDFSRTQPVFHQVEGAHYTMIGPDHVDTFSKTLKAALKERGL